MDFLISGGRAKRNNMIATMIKMMSQVIPAVFFSIRPLLYLPGGREFYYRAP